MDEMGFAEMLRLLDTKLYSPHFMPQNPKAVFQFEAWYHIIILGLTVFLTTLPVSYTHLDVYKRQRQPLTGVIISQGTARVLL